MMRRSECKDIEGQIAALRHTARKNKKTTKESNAQIVVLERQLDEMQIGDGECESHVDASPKPKLSKAQQRRNAKEAAARALTAAMLTEQEDALVAGPSEKQVEEINIKERAAGLGLEIVECRADGHCLYHSVAHQLSLVGSALVRAPDDYMAVRAIAADYMVANEAVFAPFMEEEGDYAGYCRRVRHRDGDELVWGTGTETRALSRALGRAIRVLSSTTVMTFEPTDDASISDETPLTIAYYTKLYTTGSHYNSTRPTID